MPLTFDRSLDVPYGEARMLSPFVARLLAPNPSPFTFKGTGVHIASAGQRVVVIDPGPAMPEHLHALRRAIGSRRVSHILVTHTHRDHSPAAALVKAWSGAKIYAAAGSPPQPAAPAPETVAVSLTVKGDEKAAVDEAHDHDFVPDVIVKDGDVLEGDDLTFDCVATPGHTANHMCFALREERALFSGDHVMGWSTSVIAPPDGDMGEYLASLEKLIARGDAIFYPTHGSPIPAPQHYLRELLAHRRAREAQVAAALKAGPATPLELAAHLYSDIEPALRAAAATQVLAHLVHLEQQGAVARDGLRFRLSP